MSEPPNILKIEGARENNLKDISLDLVHDKLTVVTGLSGSGKSSLAFDTVYAEGQRRYIETFSPYTRQFFDKVKKPDVDAIDNVRPAIAIQQRTRITSSRSTVGSMTDINEYLKLLWANLAQPVCPECGITFESFDAGAVAERLIKWTAVKRTSIFYLAAGIRLHFSAPARKTKGKKSPRRAAKAPEREPTDWPSLKETLIKRGFSRFFDTERGSIESLEETESIPAGLNGRILYVVLDRLRASSAAEDDETELRRRLRDSADQIIQLSHHGLSGLADVISSTFVIEVNESSEKRRPLLRIWSVGSQPNCAAQPHEIHEFPTTFRCLSGTLSIPKRRPALFSYNHPMGACEECRGFGRTLAVDLNLCIPNPTVSIRDKAIQCWAGPGARVEYRDLLRFCEAEGIDADAPWRELPEEQRNRILHHKDKNYWGLFPWFSWLERKTYKMHVRVFLARYRSQVVCPACKGMRLKPASLAYQIHGRTLPELWQLPVGELLPWVEEVHQKFAATPLYTRAIRDLFEALTTRVRFLVDLGLPYLTLDRQARTLSGGETQRVNLTTALGSELISSQFVLDEPSVGLHPRDTTRLLSAIRSLTDKGNSVLMVEHDVDCIEAADRIVELGPAAGEHGGQIIYSGDAGEWPGVNVEITLENSRQAAPDAPSLRIENASSRNLKNLSCELPLRKFVTLTGVSGSGKSTLAHEIIVKCYEQYRMGLESRVDGGEVRGFENLDQVLVIDQSPLAKSPRANIGTYSGIWDDVRSLLAATDDAQARGLTRSSFSFNVDGGRCPVCRGAGFIREDMQFLSDVYIPCDTCLGKRFQQLVLDVRFKGKDVSEFLNLTVDECREFFAEQKNVREISALLSELGLGHLRLGHSLSELSGGEAQRLKLVPIIQASRTSQKSRGSLLIFDEPTTGLHVEDVSRLIRLLRSLVQTGHSVLCIEHNLHLILAGDWIIDLGPEGGKYGGNLMGEGTPREFLREGAFPESYTAEYLREFYRRWSGQPGGKKRRRPEPASEVSGNGHRRLADNSHLHILGAREHNLKDIDVHVPLDGLIAITGVSGSGKSTIAKDIIYAEGQRRYLDCLSPYARQYIKELHKPELDHIENVKPTVCVYQHTFQPSRLSTVGTLSEIYNFLRLLYAKVGVQHCPDHPEYQIAPLTPQDIAHALRQLPERSIRLLAPVIKQKKGNHRAVLEHAVNSEITSVRIDGVFLNPATVSMTGGLPKTKAHTIEFVVGKFNPRQLDDGLLLDVINQALTLGSGTLIAHTEKGETVFSTERTCPICKRGFFKPDPEDLSFNSKRGRCEECDGYGVVPVTRRGQKKEVLVTCPECGGSRLQAIGRNLRISGLSIAEMSALAPRELRAMLSKVPFPHTIQPLVSPVMREIDTRAETLIGIGLDYLPLNRPCNTLSNGELQRLRLATAMSTSLSGAMYIFDEPSAGLHPLENARVIERIRMLRAARNSILMIEHDSDCIEAADYVIDVGPGGGKDGGRIVFSGPLDEFVSSSQTATAHALRLSRSLLGSLPPDEKKKSREAETSVLTVRKAHANNIKNLSVDLPLQKLVCIAGVSGAGKSSLIHQVIRETIGADPDGETFWESERGIVTSTLPITRILEVDQKPIGINSRSTPASYLKVWDEIRKLFASSSEAQARGWTQSFFSYNSGEGRCPECKGLGQITLEMNFLPDAQVVCETCGGARFNDAALSVRYLGLNPSEVLKLTFEEAKSVFSNHRRIHQPLKLACDLGLGYLTLGQSSTTLSGGESQRIKLVFELSGTPKGHTLYILDEPTTGLHKSDVSRLLGTLKELIARGNSIFVIEHDPDVLLRSDYVLELGPGAGDAGGKVVYAGPPLGLIAAKSAWGETLRDMKGGLPQPRTRTHTEDPGFSGARP